MPVDLLTLAEFMAFVMLGYLLRPIFRFLWRIRNAKVLKEKSVAVDDERNGEADSKGEVDGKGDDEC